MRVSQTKFEMVKRFIRPIHAEHGVVGTFRFSHGWNISDRVQICNHLIHKFGLESYLEIGTRRKSDMNDRVIAKRRASVDPDPMAQPEVLMTSDEYFQRYSEKFDLIFVDGLHVGEQVKRDIENSLKVLTDRGFIVLHDMNPPTRFHAREDYEVDGSFPPWNGTSWEGYAWHRANNPDLSMCVVDVDWGVGVVQRGQQDLWRGDFRGYDALQAHREKLLNLISVKEFLRRF